MIRFLLLTVAVLMFLFYTGTNAQLIGEGDTLWYKTGLPTVTKVQFTPDGTKLGVVGADDIGQLTMFDATNGNELWTFKKATYYFKQFAYSLDENKIYVLPPSDKKISVLDVITGEVTDSLSVNSEINTTNYFDMVFQTKNPNMLLLANNQGNCALYDINTKSIKKETIGSRTKIFASPYSNYFIKAQEFLEFNDWKFRVSLWDINTLDLVANLVEDFGVLYVGGEAKFSYNGKYAAFNFGTRALQIWDLESKKLFKEYSPTIRTETTSGGGSQASLALCHDNETVINCGGYYIDDTKGASTSITNFLNNKRALIYPNMTGFETLDINNTDTQLAGGGGRNLVMLKLKKDAVPVKENPLEPKEIIYPNPTSGNVTINIPEKFGIINSGQIFDNSGRIVKSLFPNELNTSDSKLTINLHGLQSGTYILKLNSAQDILSYKIILER